MDNWIRERTGLGSALTAENLRAWQQERVREAEIYAAEHAAFYRDRKEALLSPEPGQHFFITAEDIRRRPEDFLCVSPKEIARIIMAFAFQDYQFLLDDHAISDDDKGICKRILGRTASMDETKSCFLLLTRMLEIHFDTP